MTGALIGTKHPRIGTTTRQWLDGLMGQERWELGDSLAQRLVRVLQVLVDPLAGRVVAVGTCPVQVARGEDGSGQVGAQVEECVSLALALLAAIISFVAHAPLRHTAARGVDALQPRCQRKSQRVGIPRDVRPSLRPVSAVGLPLHPPQ
jgi:hypothetical protein